MTVTDQLGIDALLCYRTSELRFRVAFGLAVFFVRTGGAVLGTVAYVRLGNARARTVALMFVGVAVALLQAVVPGY